MNFEGKELGDDIMTVVPVAGLGHGILKQCTNRAAVDFIYVLYMHSLMFYQVLDH